MRKRISIATAALLLALAPFAGAAARGEGDGAPAAGSQVGPELFVPACAHVRGIGGTSWRTDLTVHNVGATAATYTIHLLPRDEREAREGVTLTLGPGATQRFEDILEELFGYAGAAALRLVPTEGVVIARARTFNAMALAGLGQQVDGVSADSALATGQQGRIIGLAHDPGLARGFRTSIGLLNVGAEPITVEVEYLTQTGRSLGVREVALPPFGYWQRDRAFEQVTREGVEDGLAVVRSSTPGARFLAWGSVIDNASGDAAFAPAIPVR